MSRPPVSMADLHRAEGRREVEREFAYLLGVLCRREGGRVRIGYGEVLDVPAGAVLERHEDPGGRFVEYRVR